MRYLILILLLGAAFSLSSCNSRQREDREQIQHLTDSLSQLENPALYRQLAGDLLELCLRYAAEYPDDTLSATYLIDAKDYAINVNDPVGSVRIIDDFLERYPAHWATPDMLFTQAFIYENYLGDLDRAKRGYELFLERYPDHGKMSFDARFALKHLGKSAEEVLQEVLAAQDSAAAE